MPVSGTPATPQTTNDGENDSSEPIDSPGGCVPVLYRGRGIYKKEIGGKKEKKERKYKKKKADNPVLSAARKD